MTIFECNIFKIIVVKQGEMVRPYTKRKVKDHVKIDHNVGACKPPKIDRPPKEATLLASFP
jgi:hypothetical protein